MKVCVVGNSHIGALRRAWTVGQVAGVDLVFFGVGIKQIRRLKYKGTQIVPSDELTRNAFIHTSGGFSSIEILDYDAFVLVGAGFGLPTASRIFREHSLSPREGPFDAHVISEEFAVAAISDALANSRLLRLARAVMSVSKAPLVLVPEPLPNVRIKSLDVSWWWKSEQTRAVLMKAYELSLKELSLDIAVVFQPKETITDGVFTSEKYTLKPGSRVERMMSTGTARIAPEGDMFHMNSKYGARVLNLALAKIRELRESETGKGQAQPLQAAEGGSKGITATGSPAADSRNPGVTHAASA